MGTKNYVIGGPLGSGTVRDGAYKDVGLTLLTQVYPLTEKGIGGSFDNLISIPAGVQIIDFIVDVTVPWTSATSAGLTVGKTSGASDYVGPGVAINLKTGGRNTSAPTATQLLNLYSVVQSPPAPNALLYATVTETGTGSGAGRAFLLVRYIQN